MNEQTLIPDRWKSDVLFLLVGTNPLPDFVAAYLLAKPQGQVILLHSTDTGGVATNLAHAFARSLPDATIIPREIPKTDNVLIERKLKEILASIPAHLSFGLNYTGGTKAMSVHVYRALERLFPQTVFSYLDARTLQLHVDGGDGRLTERRIVESACQVDLETLVGLHGRTLKASGPETSLTPLIGAIVDLNAVDPRAWATWCRQNLRLLDDPSKWKGNPELRTVEMPQDGSAVARVFAQVGYSGTLGDIPLPKGWKPRDLAKWLHGGWLEQHVYSCLEQVYTAYGLNDLRMNLFVHPSGADKFEFDVAAMRGYQLFALSCTTDYEQRLNKAKLVEAYVRARQMGGDEACVALVTCYSDDERLINKDFVTIEQLRREVKEAWFADRRVQVFGRAELLDLKRHLQLWIKSVNEEER